MKTNAKILRPGFLVSLASNIKGGVVYERKDLEDRCAAPGTDAMGNASACKLIKGHSGKCNFAAMTAEEVTRWETTRTIADKAEHERAAKVRGKARTLVSSVCSTSDFGLLCLANREAELDERYQEARELVEHFNATAQHTRVDVYMLKGIIPQDENSVQAICSELRKLIDQMQAGIAAGEVEAIRKAANEAKQLTQMLDDDAREKINRAIDEARDAARALTKRVVNGDEQTEDVVKELSRKDLQEAREVFDLSDDILEKIKKQVDRDGQTAWEV